MKIYIFITVMMPLFVQGAVLNYSAAEINELLGNISPINDQISGLVDSEGNPITIAEYVAQSSTNLLKGGNTHDWWFTPKITGLSRQTTTTNAPTTITNYADIITYSSVLSPMAYTTSYDIVVGDEPEEVRFYSVDGYFDVNETNGYAVSLVDGEGAIALVSDSLVRTQLVNAVATKPGDLGSIEDLGAHQYIAGTVKQHVNTNFAALIAGHDGSDADLAIYSLQDHDGTNYIRNTNCWAYALDLTCASPWNSRGDGALAGKTGVPRGQFRAATAITPKHLLQANHYKMQPGDTVRFVTSDNQVVERTVVAQQQVLQAEPSYTNTLAFSIREIIGNPSHERYEAYADWLPENRTADFAVIRLDEALPSSILPAKRLPDDWRLYMPSTLSFTNKGNYSENNENFPLVMTDQQERATIAESSWFGIAFFGGTFAANGMYPELYPPSGIPTFHFVPSQNDSDGLAGRLTQRRDTYLKFYRHKINGDSSSPALLYINDDPVIIGTLFSGVGGGGSATEIFDTEIQRIITEDFGDTNIWEAVDLSGFVEF